MKEHRYYLDHHLYNIEERMFGSKVSNLGTVKYVGDAMLDLSDGITYRCCGIDGSTLALINDEESVVLVQPILEWKTGRKREKHYAHLELIKDLTKDKWLSQVIEDGAEFYPKSNKCPKGVLMPILIIKIKDTDETITIYPDEATLEIIENQDRMMNNFAKALLPMIEEHFRKDISKRECEMKSAPKSKLQELREAQQLSQSDLAKKSGVYLQMIKKFELPENNLKNAKGSFLIAISQTLGCNIEDLLS